MPPSLVVFDLDGTLVDSAADLAAAINAMLADFGCEPLPVQEVRLMIGDGVPMLVARALAAKHCRHADPAAAEGVFMRHYASAATALTTAYPRAAEGLRALRDDGIPLAVCTNKPARISAEILGRLGLAAYFARVIGGDSLPFRKPDPRVLLALTEAFAVRPETALLVGDSEVDAATAHAAGVPFVLMKHGYRRGPAEKIRCLAALDGFGELPPLVRALV
ncbi:MAG TPA: phosphoglycolate phosphatase [Steroidobacteraceae bacterium]|jgi:phosphoglycolate phosphatase|nr:phosphoglycolate phosphatase [Steroidobacteraceae bacterium]